MALEDVRYATPKSAAVEMTADIRTTAAGLKIAAYDPTAT
jgi:hypothetical protein